MCKNLIKIAVIDDGIDQEVREFKDADITRVSIGKQGFEMFHGTFLFGIIYRNLKQYKNIQYYDYPFLYAGDLADKSYKKENDNLLNTAKPVLQKALKADFINISMQLPTNDRKKAQKIIDLFKKTYYDGTSNAIVFASSGNFVAPYPIAAESIISSSPYTISVSAYYPKKVQKIYKGKTIFPAINLRQMFTEPNSATMFAENGVHISNNTASNQKNSMFFIPERRMYIRNVTGKVYDVGTAYRPHYYLSAGTSPANPELMSMFVKAKIEAPHLSKHDLVDIALNSTEKIILSRVRNNYRNKKKSAAYKKLFENTNYNRNGRGYRHSLEFGFGKVNRDYFFSLAKDWVSLNHDLKEVEANITKEEKTDNGYVYHVEVGGSFKVQQLIVKVDGYDSSFWGGTFGAEKQKMITLDTLSVESPSGSQGHIFNSFYSPKYTKFMSDNLLARKPKTTVPPFYSEYYNKDLSGAYTAVQFWGEKKSKGIWKIHSNARLDQKNSKLFFVANFSKDDPFVIDNYILGVKEPKPMKDTDGGHNVLYLRNYTVGKCEVDKAKKEIRLYDRWSLVKTIQFNPAEIHQIIGGSNVKILK